MVWLWKEALSLATYVHGMDVAKKACCDPSRAQINIPLREGLCAGAL